MKRVTAFLLALLLCSTMILPIAAESINNSTTLTIEYERATPTFELVVPDGSTIEADKQVNYGMVSLQNTADFYGYHVDVTVTASDFVGEETKSAYSSMQYFVGNDGALCGDGSPFTISFYDVQEDGTLSNKAVCGEHTVTALGVQCYLDGNRAPGDTYKATITFTAQALPNTAA